MPRLAPVFAMLLLTGCASPRSPEWSILAPGTWFSHVPADRVDRAGIKVDETKDKARKEAQKSVYQASESLSLLSGAGRTRPVALASDFLGTAQSLLANTEGPLSVSDTTTLKQVVADLNSENAKIREKAERDNAEHLQSIGRLTDRLQVAQDTLDRANAKLRDAFERENALANELRYRNALMWTAAGIGLIATLGWLYAKISLGGIPGALGSAIARITNRNPGLGDELRSHLDTYLNRHEQQAINREVAKRM